MRPRSMFVLLVLLVVAPMWGCGGSDEGESTATATAPPAAEPAATPSATSVPIATSTIVPAPTPAAVAVPAVTGTVLYAGGAGRLGVYETAARESQSDVAWQFDAAAGLTAPVIAGDVLFVGDAMGRLYAFDPATGAEFWIFEQSGPIIAPVAVADGAVVFGTDDAGVYAVEIATMAVRWQFAAEGIVWGAPLIVDTTVCVGADNGFFALELGAGEPVWQLETGGRPIFTPPASDGDMVFFAAGPLLYAVDARDGTQRWSREGAKDWTRLAVDAGTLYVGNEEGSFYALDSATGEPRWTFLDKDRYWSKPVVAQGTVYVGNLDQSVYALDTATGALRWSFPAEDWAAADPIYAGGVLYFGTGNHEGRPGNRLLYALDATSGMELWSFSTPGLIHAAPAIAGGLVFVATTTGQLLALE